MDLNTTYMVTANLVVARDGGYQASRQVPTFYVTAISEENAETIARDIIEAGDSDRLTTIHMTVALMADITIGS